MWEYLDYIQMYEKGIPPESGAALDQLHAFNFYSRFVWTEQAMHKAQAGLDMLSK